MEVTDGIHEVRRGRHRWGVWKTVRTNQSTKVVLFTAVGLSGRGRDALGGRRDIEIAVPRTSSLKCPVGDRELNLIRDWN